MYGLLDGIAAGDAFVDADLLAVLLAFSVGMWIDVASPASDCSDRPYI